MNLTFYEALDRIPLGVAVTIEFAGPLGVAVALSRRRLDLVWVALAVAGIVLLADPFGAGGLDPVGAASSCCVAAACWAAYILLAAARRRSASRGGARAGAGDRPWPRWSRSCPGIAEAGADLLVPEILALGAAVALLSARSSPTRWRPRRCGACPPHVFGVLMSLEPAVAALAGFLVLGQRLRRARPRRDRARRSPRASARRARVAPPGARGLTCDTARPCSRSTSPTC